jgi:hypothetical protein
MFQFGINVMHWQYTRITLVGIDDGNVDWLALLWHSFACDVDLLGGYRWQLRSVKFTLRCTIYRYSFGQGEGRMGKNQEPRAKGSLGVCGSRP